MTTTKKLIRTYSIKINDIEKTQMYEMYKNSYTNAGEDLWFKTKEELFNKYPCIISFESSYLTAYAMFQLRSKYNKISLICHNGTKEGKEQIMDIVFTLINEPGWIIEAAGRVSWILRKKVAPIIREQSDIALALDVDEKDIEMNNHFDYNIKETYQYTRRYTDNAKTPPETFLSNETLFGILSDCEFQNTTECERTCNIQLAGKLKTRSRQKKNKSRKNRRKSRKYRRNYYSRLR